MAYFDNAATSYPKPEQVYKFMDEFYRSNGGNVGRGSYTLANNAKLLVDDTRTRLQRLLHCPNKQIIFEPTATIALNTIIQGLVLSDAKNIYISPFEHNAVTRTLHHLEQSAKIKIHILNVTRDLDYDLKRIKYQFDATQPDVVIISHASNMIGLVAPVEKIFELAKRYRAVTIVDMAQTAGLIDLNVGSETIDFAIFAGHKTLLAPTGIAGFIMNPSIKLPPIIFGGTGFDSANPNVPDRLPERFEVGTLNIIGIAGLNAALDWIETQTLARIRSLELNNRHRLLELLSAHDCLSIVGNIVGREYVGIVSCTIEGISSESAGNFFAAKGIAVRAGLQCAPLAHKFLGTYPDGTVRFSVNCFTTDDDFAQLRSVLDELDEEL
ncbi:MAG: aminotransferase class V-fold PLP-dependent enzyme [Selenomonadaceae bacterium]|nr:aminotransferase class V-fold PLP-dependent enzyme [Selenomonadaceae bacterium]